MASTSKPRAPAGLGTAAARFWRDAVGQYSFRLDELITLKQACREIDLIEKMEEQLATAASLITAGSMGQDAPHALLGEIRQHRALLNQQLKALGMADAASVAGHRSAQARAAAQARWSSGSAAS